MDGDERLPVEHDRVGEAPNKHYRHPTDKRHCGTPDEPRRVARLDDLPYHRRAGSSGREGGVRIDETPDLHDIRPMPLNRLFEGADAGGKRAQEAEEETW